MQFRLSDINRNYFTKQNAYDIIMAYVTGGWETYEGIFGEPDEDDGEMK